MCNLNVGGNRVKDVDQKKYQKILNTEAWQRSVSSFANLTGLTIKCVGSDGTLLGRPFAERNLCRLIRSSGKGLARCRSQCGHKIARSIKEGESVIFTCYAGLLCFSIPLLVNEKVIGAIYGGKILTESPILSKYVKLAEESDLSHEKLFKALGELRIGKFREIQSAMTYLQTIAQTMLDHSFQSQNFGQNYSKLFTLFHLGNDLNLILDNHELYGLIINYLAILFDIRGTALMLLDPSGQHFLSQSSYGSDKWDLSSLRISSHQGVVRQMLKDHQTIHTRDRFQIEKSGFNEQIKSLYLFPLHFGQRIGGLICIVNTELLENDIRMIQAFCDQASIAIQNVELKQKLKNRVLEISNLGILTSEVGEVREINELFQLILNRSTEIVKAEQASLLILDEATKQLHVKACKGISENVIKNIHVQAGDGIAGKVIQTGKPLLVKDIEKDPRIYQKKKMRYKTSSFISIPLILNERPIGVLNISDKITGEVFNNDDLKIIQIFATQVAIALERTQLYQRSKEMEQVLITDHLTGLLNRRYFFERITEELSRSQRHSHPLSLMMIDVDDFKWYNDHHGHLAGDDALRNVAAVLRDAVRNIDFVARYGGEEFVMVLPQTSKEEAVVIGERLRHEVEKFYFPYEEKQPNGNFTISMGLATYPEDAKGIKNLIEAADKALYRAKAAGKNRLCLFRPPEKGSAE
jgi:diguanylate cyclase (GGDEF)-like protein